jgi:hypothetical protein
MEYFKNLFFNNDNIKKSITKKSITEKSITEKSITEKYMLERTNKLDYFRIEPYICKTRQYEIYISGAAGLAPYLMGICKVLQDEFQNELDKSIIIGTSIGSFCAFILATKISVNDAYLNGATNFIKCIGKSFMDKSFYLTNNYHNCMNNYITSIKDIILLDSLENRLFINTSCYQTGKNYIINQFNDGSDIANAITSSSTIPVLHTSLTCEYDGKLLRDGWFSDTPYICSNLHRVDIELNMFSREWSLFDYLPDDNIDNNNMLYQLGIQDAKDNLEKLKEMFCVDN